MYPAIERISLIQPNSTSSLKFLDEAVKFVRDGDVLSGMELLKDGLDRTRDSSNSEEWRGVCSAVQSHEIGDIALLDPYTKRARYKPRKYAGDAPTLDYIFGDGPHHQNPPIENATGIKLNAFTTTLQPALAVLHRRELLEKEIVRNIKIFDNSTILSLACGHLRELDNISEILDGVSSNPMMIAIDQDTASIDIARKITSPIELTCYEAGIMDYIADRIYCYRPTLAYAAGIFDYLPMDIAKRLAIKMLSDLRSGGTLILTSFLDTTKGIGYMEAVMDWFLIYRTAGEMFELVTQDKHCSELISNHVYQEDPTGSIGYLLVIRK